MIEFTSPKSGKKLTLENGHWVGGADEQYPIVNDIPRFVSADNYANAFGFQWNQFRTTQLDSALDVNDSIERIERCLGVKMKELEGKNLLEVGCGAGRFTEIFVKYGILTHSIDLSNAVEANLKNIGKKENYKIAQASVYEIPYPENAFDVVFCLGVVQHTPSPEQTIAALYKMVKSGGLMTIDHYKWRLSYYSTFKPLYRRRLRILAPEVAYKKIKKLTDFYFPLHWKFRNIAPLNWLVHRFSPLIEYINTYPQMSREQHYELAFMDSYDSLTDYYKHLRTADQIQKFLMSLGAEKIEVWEGGNGVEARCRKPA